jgi:hypothetical protein
MKWRHIRIFARKSPLTKFFLLFCKMRSCFTAKLLAIDLAIVSFWLKLLRNSILRSINCSNTIETSPRDVYVFQILQYILNCYLQKQNRCFLTLLQLSDNFHFAWRINLKETIVADLMLVVRHIYQNCSYKTRWCARCWSTITIPDLMEDTMYFYEFDTFCATHAPLLHR